MKVTLLAQDGDAHMKRSVMLIGNYEIKPQETYLGVVLTLFDPKNIPLKWNRLDYLQQCSGVVPVLVEQTQETSRN